MTHAQLAKAIHQTKPKTSALIWYLSLKDDPECAKAIHLGKSTFYKYSYKSISKIKELLSQVSIEKVCKDYKDR